MRRPDWVKPRPTGSSGLRQGRGRLLLDALLAAARQRGYRCIVLETTATWDDAIAFYRRAGFRPVAERDGDLHFVLELGQED